MSEEYSKKAAEVEKGVEQKQIIISDVLINEDIITGLILRKRFNFINNNSLSLSTETLREKVNKNELDLDKVILVKGNNKKEILFKNSLKKTNFKF